MRRSIPRAKPYPKCPVETTLDVVGGRWKGILLFHLLTNPVLRFGELRRRVPGATQRMITLQLRELERDGCITRKAYPQMPPRVEYSITDFGRTLEPVVKTLCFWGMEHGGWRPAQRAQGSTLELK
ncbi:MAG TPA: helix-turn-helix domain-containing protein [Candidatus Cybelea sp.]